MKRAQKCWLALVAMLCIQTCTNGQENPGLVKFLNPDGVSTPKGYSHAAVIDLGNCKMVIISGQVPLNEKAEVVGVGDMALQAEQVFKNIQIVVSEFGGTMNNIVKLGYFVTDVRQIQKVRDIRDKFINTERPPASTLVEVRKLYRDDVMIEVEAMAIIPIND
jgi:2-iminobutanoate/2-iminopropanoate deaminase